MKRLTTYEDGRPRITRLSDSDYYDAGYTDDEWEDGEEREAVNEAVAKLAEYEDIGMDPEDIRAIFERIAGDRKPTIYSRADALNIIRQPEQDRVYWMQWYNTVFPVKSFRLVNQEKVKYQRFGDVGEKAVSAYGKTWVLWNGRPREYDVNNTKLSHN